MKLPICRSRGNETLTQTKPDGQSLVTSTTKLVTTAAQSMLKPDMNVRSTVSEAGRARRIHTSRALSTRGMTLVEILCVTVVLSILVLMVVPAGHRHSARARIKCVNNLKNVGLAYRIFATDNSDRFPFELSTNQGGTLELTTDLAAQFQILSNELSTPKILLCPSDYKRLKEATNWVSLSRRNVSFYVGIDASETNPTSILSGDRHFSVNGSKPPPGLVRLRTNDAVVYPKKFHDEADGANILLADGSVHRFPSKDLPRFLANSGKATNRFIVP